MTDTAALKEKPIPDDVMKLANECVAEFRWNNDNRWHLFVARAIMADRAARDTRIADLETKVAEARRVTEPVVKAVDAWPSATNSVKFFWRINHHDLAGLNLTMGDLRAIRTFMEQTK